MRSVSRLVLIVLCTLAAGASAAQAAPRQATVAGVVDGDTIRVDVGNRSAAIDLLGIRAATGCGVDAAATLGALLPRGAKVRLVRDGRRRGAYVFRRSAFINGELVAVGAAKAAGRRLRQARRLRSAQREARALRLGVWSCVPAEVAPPAVGTGGVDTAENRAELDRFVRGYRFTFREEYREGLATYQMEMVMQFCPDGRLVATYRMGADSASTTGTWKLHDVTRRDGQLLMGRFEVEFPDEDGESEPELITGGRRADGAAVFGGDEEQATATRAPADGC